ncbi:hypothetical protein L1887_19795 [Cichorium endivia]|nr:hypothetical protein L1887_19795 [Cichorium endivia]
MDNGLLKSEMNGLTEKAVMLEIEKGLVSVVVVVTQVNQLAEEKGEIEKSKSDYEFEIIALNSRLDELMAEIDEERGVSSRVCDERDELMAHLGDRIQEVDDLKLKSHSGGATADHRRTFVRLNHLIPVVTGKKRN